MENEDNIVAIRPKFIAWTDQGKYWQEDWLVETEKDGNEAFVVTLTPTPDGGANCQVSPK